MKFLVTLDCEFDSSDTIDAIDAARKFKEVMMPEMNVFHVQSNGTKVMVDLHESSISNIENKMKYYRLSAYRVAGMLSQISNIVSNVIINERRDCKPMEAISILLNNTVDPMQDVYYQREHSDMVFIWNVKLQGETE